MMTYYGLLLFFVLEYVRPSTYFPPIGVLRLNTIVPLGVIALTILNNKKVTNAEALREPNVRMILFLLGLIVMSVLTADVTLYSYNIFTAVFGYVLMTFVLTKQLTDVSRMKGVFAMLVLVHVVLALLTPEMFTDPDGRHYLSSGTFLGDGNDYALSVNVALPLCIFLLGNSPKTLHKLFWGGSLLLLVLCVIATKSRGGTIALACVGIYYWTKSTRKALTGATAVVVLALVLVSAPASWFDRMSTISSHEDGSSQGRIAAWGASVQMALDHPLLGVGAGHFPVKFGAEYRSPDLAMPWLTAHSIYFLILGELGLPGIGILLGFIISNLVMNRRATKALLERSSSPPSPEVATNVALLACLSASLVAFATGGAFLSAIYYPHIYMLAGMLGAARRIARESQAVETVPAVAKPLARIQPVRSARDRKVADAVPATRTRRA
jgi:probable O-glycosylation ligase (exosortase A-associated)